MWYNYLRLDHSETRRVRGKGARDAGHPRANANRTEGIVKEGRHTWPVTLSQSEMPERLVTGYKPETKRKTGTGIVISRKENGGESAPSLLGRGRCPWS